MSYVLPPSSDTHRIGQFSTVLDKGGTDACHVYNDITVCVYVETLWEECIQQGAEGVKLCGHA
jgi:hypothetical protein